MNITDFAIIGVVAVILSFAIGYMVKSKKSGTKCIGCPYSKDCSSKASYNCNKSENSDSSPEN